MAEHDVSKEFPELAKFLMDFRHDVERLLWVYQERFEKFGTTWSAFGLRLKMAKATGGKLPEIGTDEQGMFTTVFEIDEKGRLLDGAEDEAWLKDQMEGLGGMSEPGKGPSC